MTNPSSPYSAAADLGVTRTTSPRQMMMTTASVLPKAWSNGFVLVVLFATSNYLSLYLGMRVSSEYKYSGISNMPSLNTDCAGCNNIIASNKSSSDAIVDDADEHSSSYNLRRPQHHLHQEHQTSLSPSSWSNIPILSPNTDKKVVLVTGGAGFIGSHVASALLQRGDTVIIIDNMNDYYNVSIKESNLEWVKEIAAAAAAKQKSIERDAVEYTGDDDDENNIPNLAIHHGDINNTTLLTTIFEQQNIPITHICHLAARAGVRPSIQHPHLYIETNIMGTMNILEYARKYNVTNLVMASSSSVYGEVVVDSNNNNDNGGEEIMAFSEDFHSANTPLSPYAQTKRSVELLAYTYHALYQQMNITNLRFFTVYGPRGRPDMAPHIFISNIFRGESIHQYGDGNTSRDYTYIDDIVNGVVRSLDRSYSYQIMNVGGGSTGTTLSNFIALVEKHVGKSAKIVKKPNQMGDVSHTRANITKANMLLGYVPSVTMEEGVRRTVQWYKETYVVE